MEDIDNSLRDLDWKYYNEQREICESESLELLKKIEESDRLCRAACQDILLKKINSREAEIEEKSQRDLDDKIRVLRAEDPKILQENPNIDSESIALSTELVIEMLSSKREEILTREKELSKKLSEDTQVQFDSLSAVNIERFEDITHTQDSKFLHLIKSADDKFRDMLFRARRVVSSSDTQVEERNLSRHWRDLKRRERRKEYYAQLYEDNKASNGSIIREFEAYLTTTYRR